MSGATKDITDVSKLLLSLSRYRAETMSAMNNAVGNLRNQAGAAPAEPDAGSNGRRSNWQDTVQYHSIDGVGGAYG